MIKKITTADLRHMKDSEGLILQGCGGDLHEWMDGINDIFFDWDLSGDCDHVGIVEKVENGRVYTIKGNSGNACRRCSYPVGYSQIVGYGVLSV